MDKLFWVNFLITFILLVLELASAMDLLQSAVVPPLKTSITNGASSSVQAGPPNLKGKLNLLKSDEPTEAANIHGIRSATSHLGQVIYGSEGAQFPMHTPIKSQHNHISASSSANCEDGQCEANFDYPMKDVDVEIVGMNIVPGWSFVGVGFDASRKYGSYENARRSIFRDTTRTFDQSQFLEMLVPNHLMAMPIFSTRSSSKVFMSRQEAQKSLAVRASLSADANVFGMSFGMGFSSSSDSNARESSESTLAQYEIASEQYQLLLMPRSFEQSEPDFQNFVKQLHDEIQSLHEAQSANNQFEAADVNSVLRKVYGRLHHFLNTYGTHVVTSAVMGGSLVLESTMCQKQSSERESLAIEMTAYFKSAFGSASGGMSNSESKSKFENSKSSNIRYIATGGDPVAARMISEHGELRKGFSIWLQTIHKYPSIVRFGLKPIYELIPSSTMSALRLLMKLSLDLYLDGTPAIDAGIFHLPASVPKFSSLSKLPKSGSGHVQFDATVTSSLTIMLNAVPQTPLISVTLSTLESSYTITSTNNLGQRIYKKVVTRSFDVPRGVSQTFWFNLENCKLHYGMGEFESRSWGSESGNNDYEEIDLWEHCQDISYIRFVGFETSDAQGVRLVNLLIEEGHRVKSKPERIETCAILRHEKNILHDGPQFLRVAGGQTVRVECKNMQTASPLEFIPVSNVTSGLVGLVEPSNQAGMIEFKEETFGLLRFVPKHFALDLCDASNGDINKINDPNSLRIYPGVVQMCGEIYEGHALYGTQNLALLKGYGIESTAHRISSDSIGNRINMIGTMVRLRHNIGSQAMTVTVDSSTRGPQRVCGETWFGDAQLAHRHYRDFAKCESNEDSQSGKKLPFSEYKALRIAVGEFKPKIRSISLSKSHAQCHRSKASYKLPLSYIEVSTQDRDKWRQVSSVILEHTTRFMIELSFFLEPDWNENISFDVFVDGHKATKLSRMRSRAGAVIYANVTKAALSCGQHIIHIKNNMEISRSLQWPENVLLTPL